MTLPDIMDKENAIDARRLKTMGHTLRTCIKQSLKRKGLTSGMASCGELLQNQPGTVMMCILPKNCSNISATIHQTLIRAFCSENNILIIELADGVKLAALIKKLTSESQVERVKGNAEDTNCMLLQFPKRGLSKHDHTLFQFYEELKARAFPLPQMSLPD